MPPLSGWTLEYKGVEKPFAKEAFIAEVTGGQKSLVAGWGLSNPVIQFGNQVVDVLTFEQPGADFGSTPIFESGQTVIVRLDGVKRFSGELRAPRRQGTANDSGFSWRAQGPWFLFERIVFRQPWQVYSDSSSSTSELITKYAGRLFLGQRSNGVLQDTKQQIIEIVAWANSQNLVEGAATDFITLDTAGIPEINIPVMEVRNAFCSECIIKILQLAPDAVAWVDYSTDPLPTLRIKRRTDLTVVELDSSAGNPFASASISPKDALVTSAVVIEYEKINQVNGVSIRDLSYDIWGAPEEAAYPSSPVEGEGSTGIGKDTLWATVNLEGVNVSFASQQIVCAPILSNSNTASVRATWWKTKRPELAKVQDVEDSNSRWVANLVIDRTTRSGTLANEITAGSYADWMAGSFASETIEAYATYEIRQMIGGVSTVVEKHVKEPIDVKIKTTSLSTGTYFSAPDPTSTYGEAVPSGLARAIYNSASVLQYDGDIALLESECSGLVAMGNTVNLIGGASEFATMKALVQSVTLNIVSGETSIQVGFPRIWTAEDFMEMLRGLRYRARYTPLGARTTGRGGISGNTELGKDSAKESHTQGKSAKVADAWYAPADPTGPMVKINIEDLKANMTLAGITALQTGSIQPRIVEMSRYNATTSTCENGIAIVMMSGFIAVPAGFTIPSGAGV